MKKKNAFTLIELLAVIVVLAIIALIATPIVMNTIKNAKKGAAERSADSYIGAVETVVATERLDGNILEGEYIIQSDGNLCPTSGCGNSDKDKIVIDVKGTKPSSGKITISNGNVDKKSSEMTIGDYDVSYDEKNKKYEATKKDDTSSDDNKPTTLTCELQEGTSQTVGAKYTCHLDFDRPFYVLETSGDNISLIMDRNFVGGFFAVSWCIDGGDNNTTCENINSTGEESLLKNVQDIFGGNIAVSFPTASQIATASGKSFNNNSVSGLATWIYDYLEGTANSESEVYGYWTTSPCIDDSEFAWTVYHDGSIVKLEVNDGSGNYGVRPVITISKSQLN